MKISPRQYPALAMMLLLAPSLPGCSSGDRQYLLTYDHPKSTHPIAAANIPQGGAAIPSDEPPRVAATQPVSVEPPPANLAPPAEVAAPAGSARPRETTAGLSETPPRPVDGPPPSPMPPISEADTTAPPAAPTAPDTVPSQAFEPEAAKPVNAPSSPAVSTAPVVITIKPPPAEAEMSAPPPSRSRRAAHLPRPSPSLVRPPPPPLDSVAVLPAPPEAVVPSQPQTAEQAAAPIVSKGMTANPAPAAAASEVHCRGVAAQRKRDAAANGYDDTLQQQIFDGTLKNCMDWSAQH